MKIEAVAEALKIAVPTMVPTADKQANLSKNVLINVLGELNKDQKTAEKNMMDISTGRVNNLQKAVLEIDKASLSLALALEIKNKALGAYKEVMNIQV